MMARMMAMIMGGDTPDKIFAIEIAGLPDGYRLGTGVKIVSGERRVASSTPWQPRATCSCAMGRATPTCCASTA